jgi:hypothetical protein
MSKVQATSDIFLYLFQKVSKAPHALDTFLLYRLKNVQSTSYFGHIYIYIPKSVQSTSPIGHILAVPAEKCPKYKRLWTYFYIFFKRCPKHLFHWTYSCCSGGKMSKVQATSDIFLYLFQKVSKAPLPLDTFLLFRRKDVQRSSYFGHFFRIILLKMNSQSRFRFN